MNNIAIAGLVGGGIGAVKGIIDQKEAQKYDPQAGTSVGSYISNSLRDGLEFAAIAAGGAGIAAAVKNPKAVAEAISGSKIKESNIYKTIIPGKKQLTEEVATRMSGKTIINSAGIKDDINILLKDYIDAGINISDNVSNAFKTFEKSKLDDNAIQELEKALRKDKTFSDLDIVDETVDEIVDDIKSYVRKYKSSKKITTDDVQNLKWYQKAKEYTSAYYLNPDKKTRNTRIAATVGTASALAVGGRYLSGGTLTTDRYGQKDIAGIPFI